MSDPQSDGQEIALGVPQPLRTQLQVLERQLKSCSDATGSITRLQDVSNTVGRHLHEGSEQSSKRVKALKNALEKLRNTVHRRGDRFNAQTSNSVGRAQVEVERMFLKRQGSSGSPELVRKEELDEIHDTTIRDIQVAREELLEAIDFALDEMCSKLDDADTERRGDASYLSSLLANCAQGVMSDYTRIHSSWIRCLSQLVGSNMWAMAWPEAARAADNRSRLASGERSQAPPEYGPDSTTAS